MKSIFMGIALAMLAGCATHIPVNRETGSLNFDYTTKTPAGKQNGKPIAIVSPQFVSVESRESQSAQTTIDMILSNSSSSMYQAQLVYQATYRERLADAMMSTIQEIFSKRGFTTKGPYATFDDIPFGEKKTIYLAAMPSLKIYFDQKRQTSSCKGMVCTDQGVFTVTGELIYKMVEPMTGQALVTKRINLSDFSITKNYTRDFQNRTQSEGVLGAAMDKALNPEFLRDNTDRVMSEALSEFFQKSMAKIDTFISGEELLSFEQDVAQLKGLKRF
jgi:hypothetical protein